MARHADVVVIDWRLGRNSEKARRIIRRIIAEDAKENGRLRLIAVYTGETGLEGLRDQVLEDLKSEGVQAAPTDLPGPVAIRNGPLKIVFLNKQHAGVPVGSTPVSEEALPAKLVEEFAEMSRGIMPAVALGSITAVRASTHHILAKFHPGLDGALAAHRILSTHPEDAETYVTGLLAEELAAVLETSGVGGSHASIDVLKKWVSGLEANGFPFHAADGQKQGIGGTVAVDLLKLGAGGHEKWSTSTNPPIGKKTVADAAARIFYKDAGAAERANLEFSRMAALKREAYGSSSPPSGWLPTLTLGGVIAALDDPGVIYACIQPVCDAVRISDKRRFPLVPLLKNDANFSIVLQRQDGAMVRLEPDHSPHQIQHIEFGAATSSRTVRARQDGPRYLFDAADGRCFEWLADLKGFIALRLIQRSAGQVDRVGLDEFEWLRKKAKKSSD